MKRIIVIVLLAASVAMVAPAISVSPAFAAEARCNPNELPFPPQKPIANLRALQWSGSDMVLAVTPPWAAGSNAYIWGMNGEDRQKWVMDCVGYDSVNGLNLWRMRYGADISLCLQPFGSTATVEIQTCGLRWADELWQILPAGGGDVAYRNVGQHKCLHVLGAGHYNGDELSLQPCNIPADTRQRWYTLRGW